MSDALRSTVPTTRLARLSRSVNISRWFRYPVAQAPEHFLNFITDGDLIVLAQLGVTAVRFTVAMDQIAGTTWSDGPIPERFEYVRAAINRITAHGMAVVLVIHDVPRTIETRADAADGFVQFWSSLARQLADSDPDAVLFEPLNEPVFGAKPLRWFELETRLFGAIREFAPAHTLVTGGTHWSPVDGALLKRQPASDPNVVYTFHFYEPFVFTHQGAPWQESWVRDLRGVPYPLTAKAVRSQVSPTEPSYQRLIGLATQPFGTWEIECRITSVADWSFRHAVPVWVGEFGCHPPFAPRDSVLSWFTDVRQAFERNGIGWCVWSYDEPLGLNRQWVGEAIELDLDVALALGLNDPRSNEPA